MILHIDSDAAYLSEPWAHSRTVGHYYLSLLPANPEKSPNLPPPANGPINTEWIILKHVVASAAEEEVRGLFQKGQTAVLLRTTLHEVGSPQPPTPTKTDNSAAEGIIINKVRQKSSKAIDIIFYWMKERVKQKYFFIYWKPGSQPQGCTIMEKFHTHTKPYGCTHPKLYICEKMS